MGVLEVCLTYIVSSNLTGIVNQPETIVHDFYLNKLITTFRIIVNSDFVLPTSNITGIVMLIAYWYAYYWSIIKLAVFDIIFSVLT